MAGAAVLERMAERFVEARRVLNSVTEQYLYPVRGQWFRFGQYTR